MSFEPKDLVWYEKDGEIHSAGYSIDSLIKSNKGNVMKTLNSEEQTGGGSNQFSDLFRFMGVPVGLSNGLSEDIANVDINTYYQESGTIDDNLFDKLIELVSPQNKDHTIEQTGGNKTNNNNNKSGLKRRQTKRKNKHSQSNNKSNKKIKYTRRKQIHKKQ